MHSYLFLLSLNSILDFFLVHLEEMLLLLSRLLFLLFPLESGGAYFRCTLQGFLLFFLFSCKGPLAVDSLVILADLPKFQFSL